MFVTAFHDARIHDRVMRAGAVCCLAKPFNRNEFLNCIRSALRGRKSGEQPS
jgi:FixJ family two-component response regulator